MRTQDQIREAEDRDRNKYVGPEFQLGLPSHAKEPNPCSLRIHVPKVIAKDSPGHLGRWSLFVLRRDRHANKLHQKTANKGDSEAARRKNRQE